MIAWLAGVALACEPLAAQVVAARAAVDDAEIAVARAHIDGAYKTLPCQETPASTQDLLALYRLDGVVALAAEDRARAVYAVLRAAAVDPVSAIDAERDGPELASLFGTYAPALAENRVAVRVADGGTAWVDGRPVRLGEVLEVAKGEHLVQIESPDGLVSTLESVSADRELRTGKLVAVPPEPATPGSALPPPAPRVSRRADVPSRIAWISGLALGAAGGAALGMAWTSERNFLAEPYQDDAYGGCARGEPCWASGRAAEIDADAQRIRLFYAAGYGLTGVGGALFVGGVTGAAVRPRPTVQVTGAW
ncbi:MAG: hypothetical protein H0V89_09180 [Deltaproteobacteria bacterium]|nr:hypothetical protein [Deltaproteobacteria bacterium]